MRCNADILSSSLWRGLLPPGVAAYETAHFIHSASLHPQEFLAVRNAMPKRIEEFAAGRACAHRALTELGCETAALPRGADRCPVWPDNITGSISHAQGHCAAAVTWRHAVAGIGIDVELIGQLGEDMLHLICTPAEHMLLATMEDAQRAEATTVLFSAKEAFFKCQSSAGGARPDFQDLELDLQAGVFFVAPCRGFVPAGHGPLQGCYKVSGGMVFTAITFRAN